MNTVDDFLLDSNSLPELNEHVTKKWLDFYVDTRSLQHSRHADRSFSIFFLAALSAIGLLRCHFVKYHYLTFIKHKQRIRC